MQEMNQSISALAKGGICSDCFAVESNTYFKEQNFDHEGFVNDPPKMEKDFTLDMAKFKFTKKTTATLMSLQAARTESKAHADKLYREQLKINGGDGFAKIFT